MLPCFPADSANSLLYQLTGGLSWLQDKDMKARPPGQRSHNHKEGSKAGGGGSQHSFRGKSADSSHAHHYSNRHHRAGVSVDGVSGGASGGRILSSNRFEKLEIDPEQEPASGPSLGPSTSKDNLSNKSLSSSTSSSSTSPSSSLSLSSSSSSMTKGEEKKPAKERSGRSGRGSFRGRGSAKAQGQDNGDGARSAGSQREEKGVKDKEEEGGQKKRSPKQIRFELPADSAAPEQGGEAVPPEPTTGGVASASGEWTKPDPTPSDLAASPEEGTVEDKIARIVYDRVRL